MYSEKILGVHPKIEEVRRTIILVASTDSRVMIYGESGVGKELVARAIHERSRRSEKPFYASDLSTYNLNLLEAELFGAERGAYTGLTHTWHGLFERANGGSLFLDEIQDLPLETQRKIFRVLQEGTFQRLGGEKILDTNVRLITASSGNLETLLDQGKLDKGFFYRVRIVPIYIPPLRERISDVGVIAEYHIAALSQKYKKPMGISKSGIAYLQEQPWPGNVRELIDFIEAAFVLKKMPESFESPIMLESHDFENLFKLYKSMSKSASRSVHMASDQIGGADMVIKSLEEAERDYIRAVLDMCGGNISKAANKLGISRYTVRVKLEKRNDDKKPSPL